MDIGDKKVIYCPICAATPYRTTNIFGEVVFKDEEDRTCRICGKGLYEVADEIYDYSETVEHKVLREYVIDNPQYNKAAHIERLRRQILKNAETGFDSPNELYELKEFCGVEMEQPTLKPRKPAFTPSNIVKCPRCGSTSIATKDKFSTGKSIIGGLFAGTAGAIVGGKGSNKVLNVCQKCGHKWEPGKR